MPRLLLSVALALSGCLASFGQTTQAIPTENAWWKEYHITIAGPMLHYIAVCGDTLLDDTHWSKVFDVQVDSSLQITGSTYLGAIRSDEMRAWFIPSDSNQALLLYDFSLQAGDSIELHFPYFEPSVRKVDSTGTIVLGGKTRKVIYFDTPMWGYGLESWIEGIGSNLGLLNRGLLQGPDFGFSLACFRHGDELIGFFQDPCDFPGGAVCMSAGTGNPALPHFQLLLFPNPASDWVRIELSEPVQSDWLLQVFDAHGKSILERKGSGSSTSFQTMDWPAGTYYVSITTLGKHSISSAVPFVLQR